MKAAAIRRAASVLAVGAVLATTAVVGARLWDMNGSLDCNGETGDRFERAYMAVYTAYLLGLLAATSTVATLGLAWPSAVDPRAIVAVALCGAALGACHSYLGPCP